MNTSDLQNTTISQQYIQNQMASDSKIIPIYVMLKTGEDEIYPLNVGKNRKWIGTRW